MNFRERFADPVLKADSDRYRKVLELRKALVAAHARVNASIWATPTPTGYAYYAPPGAFWGR